MGPRQDNSTMSTNDKETLWVIPKLTTDGSNWVTFKTQFLFAMAGRNVDGHFDGSDATLPTPTDSTSDDTKWTTMDCDKSQTHSLQGSMMSTLHVLNSHRLYPTHSLL